MADHTSCTLFSDLFETLAIDVPLDRKGLAEKLWEMSNGYDFHPCQMGCDEALIKLGLAKKVWDKDDYEVVYKGEGSWRSGD